MNCQATSGFRMMPTFLRQSRGGEVGQSLIPVAKNRPSFDEQNLILIYLLPINVRPDEHCYLSTLWSQMSQIVLFETKINCPIQFVSCCIRILGRLRENSSQK